MKTIWMAITGAVITLALMGRAEAADSKIILTLDEGLIATATLENKGGENFTACRVKGQFDVAEVSNPAAARSEIGRAQAGDDFPLHEASRFVVAAIQPGAAVECTKKLRSELTNQGRFPFRSIAPADWKQVGLSPLTYAGKPGKGQSFAPPAFSPGNDWLVYTRRWRTALSAAIGEPKACKVLGPGGVEKKDIGCTPGIIEGDGLVRFKVDQDFEPSQLNITFSGSKSPEAKVRVVPCTFETAGDLPSIVQGATSQHLRLTSKQPECLGRLERLTSLVLGAERIHASPSSNMDEEMIEDEPGRWINLGNVPAGLALGEQTFQLKGATGNLGKAGIVVLSKITAGDKPKLGITYHLPDDAKGFEALFQGANGVNEGVAVVSPKGAPNEVGKVRNTANISFPPLPDKSNHQASGAPAGAACPADVRSTGKHAWVGEARSETLQWAVEPKDLRDITIITGPRGQRPDVIGFEVTSALEQPLRVAVKLVAIVDAKTDWLDTTDQKRCVAATRREQTLLESEVKLADSARVESVPLPVRDRLYVDCRGAKTLIVDGQMRSIAHDDVTNGMCALVFVKAPFSEVNECDKWTSLFKLGELPGQDKPAGGHDAPGQSLKPLRDVIEQNAVTLKASPNMLKMVNPLFGPQRLLVTFKRDGAEVASQLWDVDPSTSTMLVLPKGTDGKSGDVYDVDVRIAAKSSNGVQYRGAVADEGSAALSPRTEHRYHASLRSRGIFGIPPVKCQPTVGVRIYATIPIQLTGFRFPAAPGELRSSSDPSKFQYLTPRVGLLGVIEPWNYDTGKNAWALNPNFSFGLLALELTKPRLELSTLLGVQVKLPLGDASGQLTSSAALGAFWEHDVNQPFERGNRFLLTFGANVFSLFSGK